MKKLLTIVYRKLFHIITYLNGCYWKLFIGQAGKKFQVAHNVRIQSPHNLKVGHHVFINFDSIIDCHAPITIGNNVRIAYRVLIITSNHKFDTAQDLKNNSLTTKGVKIGNNCWISANSIILPGVSIKDNCIVGAGAVVTKTFPPNSVIAGNPARVVKKRPQLNDK